MSHWVGTAILGLVLLGCRALSAADEHAPEKVAVPPMRTSIYVGSVTLSVTDFERDAGSFDYSADYHARVIPWWFWTESGTITLKPTEGAIERLLAGETIEVDGEAMNHNGKPRTVSARIRPSKDGGGTIKVRIDAGGTKLVFDGSYTFE